MKKGIADLYAGYLYEKEGKEVINYEGKGFAAFFFDRGHIHIDILYVSPLHRREGIGTKIADTLVKKYQAENLKGITAAVYTRHHDAMESLIAISSYGFKIVGSDEEKILLYKEIKNG